MSLPDFAIVDPHIHQWDPLTTPRLTSKLVKIFGNHPRAMQWLAKIAFPRRTLNAIGVIDYVAAPFLPPDYMSSSGELAISHIVHIEAGWHDAAPLGPVGETRWIDALDFAAAGTRLGAIVACADPAADNFAELLDAHLAASPRVRGIRAMAAHSRDKQVHDWYPQPGRFTDADFLHGFEHIAGKGLSFDAWIFDEQFAELTALARRFPETPIVLDHFGGPIGIFGPFGSNRGATEADRKAIFARWSDDIAELATLPNVSAKLSGLLMPHTGHGLHQQSGPVTAERIATLIAPVVEHTLQQFGAERCMFASNFPMDRVAAPLATVVDAYAQVVAPQGTTAMQQVFRDTAKRFYRITD